MDYFDTLLMYSFMLTLKPSRSPFNSDGTTFQGYTMRYKDVANRLVASPALPIDKKTAFDAVSMPVVVLRAYQQACCLCQVLCLLIVNVGAATGRLVTSLYHTVSPRKAVSSPQG